MTLILTRASYQSIIQVSDRLVTKGGEKFDPLANKSLLLLARNGLVTLSYTGLAYIQGIPTDQWLAEKLAETSYQKFDKPPAMRIRNPPNKKNLGLALISLRDELTSLGAGSKVARKTRIWRRAGLHLSIAGWQWNKKGRYRPVLADLYKEPYDTDIHLQYHDRNWFMGRTLRTLAVPSENIPEEDLAHLVREMESLGPVKSEDAMGVVLPPPTFGWAKVRYMPTTKLEFEIRGGKTVKRFPGAFTPWMIGPRMVLAPSIVSGKPSAQLGWLKVKIVSPGEQDGFGVISGQTRPSE